jgi:hypothetical protein
MTGVRAIGAMVAPVVLVTAAAIMTNGFLTLYGEINDRMRAMSHERFSILRGRDGTLLSTAELPADDNERIKEIDIQLPVLLRHHQLIHNSLLIIYLGVTTLVVSILLIGLAVSTSSRAVGYAALGTVVGGTTMLLVALLVAGYSVRSSQNAIVYEVKRTMSLGTGAR